MSKKILLIALLLTVMLIFASVLLQNIFNNSNNSNTATNLKSSTPLTINNTTTPNLTPTASSPSPSNEPTIKEEEKSITISFAGDILLDRGVKRNINNKGFDYVIPEAVRKFLSTSDIAMVNLENPISNRGTPVPDKEWTFRADPEHFSILELMGIDIVNLANNHILDYGQEAFLDTLDILDENNIHYVGGGINEVSAYSPKILEAKDKKVAFLGANRVMPDMSWYARENRPGLSATYNPKKLIEAIKNVRPNVDYVVVYVHWGVERKPMPEDYQLEMAKQYIDAGADIVVGSHPHIMQGFEIYKGKVIAYSLGNFIFTDSSKDTAILQVTLNNDGTQTAQIIPCKIKSLRTLLMDGEQVPEYFKYLESISFGVAIDDNGYLIDKLN